MTEKDFIKEVTANGNTMYSTSIAEGDKLTFVKADKHSVNGGTPFVALFTSDQQFISANAFLRIGNGISYSKPTDRGACAKELFGRLKDGYTVTIAKKWKTPSPTLTDANGNPAMVNNYRFREG